MLEQGIRSFLGIWPRYVAALGAVLGAPIAETEARARSGLYADAVTFWAISTFLYLATRYLAWAPDAAPSLWFAARFATWIVSLFAVALAVFGAGRLLGGRAGPGAVLSATAYLWAAVIPVQAVLVLIGVGLMELIDARLYAMAVAVVSGCPQLADPAAARAWMAEAIAARPAAYLTGLGLLAAVTLAVNLIVLIYGIAYLRVLRRLHRLGPGRFALFVPAVLIFAVLALSLGEFFGWELGKAQTACGAMSGAPPR